MRRAFCSRWFIIAVLATTLTLWSGLGNISYLILHASIWGRQIPWLEGMTGSLSAQLASIALPVLSAMPFAAKAFMEIHSGVYRMASFRTGNGAYRYGKIATCGLSGMLTQLLGFCLFGVVLYLLYLHSLCIAPEISQGYTIEEAIPFPSLNELFALWPQLAVRMVCAGGWACLGGSIALMTKTAIAAYIGPLMVSFCLTLVASRFLTGIPFVNPSTWLEPAFCCIALLFLAVSMLIYNKILKWEMTKRA